MSIDGTMNHHVLRKNSASADERTNVSSTPKGRGTTASVPAGTRAGEKRSVPKATNANRLRRLNPAVFCTEKKMNANTLMPTISSTMAIQPRVNAAESIGTALYRDFQRPSLTPCPALEGQGQIISPSAGKLQS